MGGRGIFCRAKWGYPILMTSTLGIATEELTKVLVRSLGIDINSTTDEALCNWVGNQANWWLTWFDNWAMAYRFAWLFHCTITWSRCLAGNTQQATQQNGRLNNVTVLLCYCVIPLFGRKHDTTSNSTESTQGGVGLVPKKEKECMLVALHKGWPFWSVIAGKEQASARMPTAS